MWKRILWLSKLVLLPNADRSQDVRNEEESAMDYVSKHNGFKCGPDIFGLCKLWSGVNPLSLNF